MLILGVPLSNQHTTLPIGSMYGIFAYIYYTNQLNVGKYISPMGPMGYRTYLFLSPRPPGPFQVRDVQEQLDMVVQRVNPACTPSFSET